MSENLAGTSLQSWVLVTERGQGRDRYTERNRKSGWQCDADSATFLDRDRDSNRDRNRDRQYTPMQRPSKQFNMELNKKIIRISTRESAVKSFQCVLQGLTTWPQLSAKS
jgi:hypothetical protein